MGILDHFDLKMLHTPLVAHLVAIMDCTDALSNPCCSHTNVSLVLYCMFK